MQKLDYGWSVKSLYAFLTGDTATHQRTIGAAFKHLSDRQQRIFRARVDGQSFREIAATEGVSVGSIQSVINIAAHTLEKRIAKAPRYSVSRRRTAA